MGDISKKLNYLIETKKVIKDAITAKGVSVSDADTFRSYAEKISSINGYASPNDVNLYDYDGTCVHSYSASEFLVLTELPKPPMYARFASSRWNWGLDAAQEYVRKTGAIDIGALYTLPSKVQARFYLDIRYEEQRNIRIRVGVQGTSISIDWGDGSPEESANEEMKTHSHAYASVGDYCITIKTSGQLYVGAGAFEQSASAPNTNVIAIELGKVRIQGSAFYACKQLRTISVAYNTEFSGDAGGFGGSTNLKAICSPNRQYGYDICKSSAFTGCVSLKVACLGQYDSLHYGKETFKGCSALNRLLFVDGYYATTGLGNKPSFADGCLSLTKVVLDSYATAIPKYTFRDCSSLLSVKTLASIANIAEGAFDGCVSLKELDLRNQTIVPTLGGSLNQYCKVVIPDALYDEWIAASNWSTYASQIIKASEYNG